MTGNFFESETKENLMRAFAGESQARNRYTIAAEKAREKGMNTIADVFLYTADQERAHAERFYELLKKQKHILPVMIHTTFMKRKRSVYHDW